MMKSIARLALAFFVSGCVWCVVSAQDKPKSGEQPAKPASKSKGAAAKQTTAPLNDAIIEVEKVLNVYQARKEVQDGTLPGLATADFDFKTVVDTKGGISISFLIFTIGGSKDKQTTTDIDFQYAPKAPIETEAVKVPEDFEKQLMDTVMQSAQTVLDQQKIQEAMGTTSSELVFKQMTVQVGYGVTYEIDASGKAVIHLVTLSGSLTHSTNEVESVKLTFARPQKGGPTGGN